MQSSDDARGHVRRTSFAWELEGLPTCQEDVAGGLAAI
jgi:hypothetical protein